MEQTSKIKVIKKFNRALKSDKKVKVFYGGAGSGKSEAIAQFFALNFVTQDNIKLLVMRKTRPSLKMTCYPLIKKYLDIFGVAYNENKTDMVLSFKNNLMFFSPLDDVEKIKSFEAKYVWIEEATETRREDFTQLTMRLDRTSNDGVIILSFNPVDQYHWCITDLVQGNRPDALIHHSTYKDNPFLADGFRNTLEDLINRDENFYRIYTLGEPGVLKNIVFDKYEITPFEQWPQAVRERKPDCYGLDFGWVDPMALVAVWMHEGRLYWKEIIYQTNLTTDQLIALMKEKEIDKTTPIESDSAEPGQIQELCNAGFNARATKKETITGGIDYIKSHGLTISSDSTNLIKEIRAYKFKEDKDGRVFDEPVDFMNHALDSGRYGSLYFKALEVQMVGGFGNVSIW
jgi:phage terminase large subunit